MSIDHPYLCNECKKIINDPSDLLFVEEGSSRGFCSEECIEDFYLPYMKYFDDQVLELRRKHQVIDEKEFDNENDQMLVDIVAKDPDEIWRSVNDLKEEIFYYLKFYDGIYIVVVCTIFNETPSFILSLIKTRSQKLAHEFKIGEKLDIRQTELSNANNAEEDEDVFIESLENKKSSLLGDIINHRKESDINFEDFISYDIFLEETLANPDEIYELKDREGDKLTHFLKSFVDSKFGSFFYVVIGMKKINSSQEEMFYPILSFPTNDISIFQDFRKGDRVLSPIKN
jgi:hypothetical protein